MDTEPLRDFLKGFISVASRSIMAPYMMPTAKRVIDEYIRFLRTTNLAEPSEATKDGWSVGATVGVVGDIGQLAGYGYLAVYDHPEALLFPLATNLISGSYEWCRKNKVFERDHSQLEQTAETPNKPTRDLPK